MFNYVYKKMIIHHILSQIIFINVIGSITHKYYFKNLKHSTACVSNYLIKDFSLFPVKHNQYNRFDRHLSHIHVASIAPLLFVGDLGLVSGKLFFFFCIFCVCFTCPLALGRLAMDASLVH